MTITFFTIRGANEQNRKVKVDKNGFAYNKLTVTHDLILYNNESCNTYAYILFYAWEHI